MEKFLFIKIPPRDSRRVWKEYFDKVLGIKGYMPKDHVWPIRNVF